MRNENPLFARIVVSAAAADKINCPQAHLILRGVRACKTMRVRARVSRCRCCKVSDTLLLKRYVGRVARSAVVLQN
jgi:hypothetical protein